MRIVAIGDIHGRTIWKDIVEKEDYDMVVFIGDYVDSHDNISGNDQAENLRDILNFKRQNPDNTILITGNHDRHYFPDAVAKGVSYSGFQGHMVPTFKHLFSEALNEGIIQPCYIWEDIIFSHAGVSKTWCKNHSINTDLLEMSIQDLFEKDKMAFGFQMPHKMSMFPDWSGDDVWQSPLWIRPKSLHKDKLDGYRQVVGHSQVSKIAELDGIILIDYLPNGYLVIEDGEFKPVDL